MWLAAWKALNPTFTKGRKSYCRPHSSRSLRRGSAAARFLGLRARIPPAVLKFVSCGCCQVEVSASGWSLVLPSVVRLSVILKPRQWGVPGSLGTVAPKKKRYFIERLRRLIPDYAKRKAKPFHFTKQRCLVLIHSTKHAGVWGHYLDL